MARMEFPLKNITLQRAVSIEIILLTTVMAYFLPGGDDLYRFYLPVAQGCPQCGFNPWFASWVFFPLTLVPIRFLWTVWVFVTGVVYFWACEKFQTNPLVVLLAFPMFGQIWLGQTDAIILLGIVLYLTSPNPYVRGLGIVLAATKPHVTAAALLVLLWYDRDRWKTLIVPTLVGIASLIVWGPDWPLKWWATRDVPEANGGPANVWTAAAIVPLGLLTFLLILLVKEKTSKVAVALIAMALSVQRFGVYSYGLFMVFAAPWWSLPLSYAWALSYPWFGAMGIQFAWVLPLGILIYLIWPDVKERYDQWKSARDGANKAPQRAEQ
jgi:glycosyl transferase family 87